MKILKIFQNCLAALALCVTSQQLIAQEACCDGPSFCLDDVYLRVGYTSARGIGRTPGYGTFGAYYDPMPTCGCVAPYIDVRAHYLDNSRWAINSGLGLQYATNDGTLWRGYVFYDWLELNRGIRGYRRGNHNRKNVDQISFGFERIGQEFDVRGNVYLPTHERRELNYRQFHYPGGFVARQKRFVNLFRGFDLEASTCINLCDLVSFYTSAGLYYWYTDHDRHHNFGRPHKYRNKNSVGGKFRLETTIYRGLVGGVQVAYDERFQTCVSGEINWNFPFPGCDSKACDDCFCMFPVRRQELIVTDSRCHWKTNY
jgi:hypothetical protein